MIKKNPIFFTALFALLIAFIGGVGANVYMMMEDSKSESAFKQAKRKYASILGNDPSQAELDKAVANNNNLENQLDRLVKELTRDSESIFKKQTASEGFQLVEELRGIVYNWRKTAREKGIVVQDDMDFSYKKYVAPNSNPPPTEAVAPLWRQYCVMDHIMQKLLACKTVESPMSIVSVQREFLEEEGIKSQSTTRVAPRRNQAASVVRVNLNTDDFQIEKNVTARVPGSISTLAYRFTFTGHTDILRRFLNQLKDFDAMLVVRSIDVKPADPMTINRVMGGGGNSVEALFGFGADDAAPVAEDSESGEVSEEDSELEALREPVVTDNISQFMVVIEYVDVIKENPAQKLEGESDKDKGVE